MCRALRDGGVDVLLATTDAGLNGSPRPALQTITRHQELPVIFFKKQLGDSFKYSRPFSQWLYESTSDFDVVHIHAVFNHACIAAARVARQQRVPYIVRPLGTLTPWAMAQKSLRKKLFWHGAIKSMMQSAAAVHYTGKSEQQVVESSLGLNHGFVVPLGVEVATTSVENLFREHFHLNQSPYILVLSRLLPTKGIDVLLDAFLSVAHSELSDWRLVLAGDGPADYVASLKASVMNQNAADRVLFTEWLSGEMKASALQGASLLALPSHHENFGLCVMEALAYGVPVLISPHVSLAPEIEDAGAGWIAPVSKRSVQQALIDACSSKEALVRRGLAGKEFATKFQWPFIARQLIDLYEAVAHRAVIA